MMGQLSLFAPDPDRECLEAGLAELIFAPVEAQAGLNCYLLLDAAASADIAPCLPAFEPQARCLFDGVAGDDLADVGPWLAPIRRHSPAYSWFAEEGFGAGWGLVLHSRLALPNLKARLKRFLKVTDETGESFFFKFYTPRNLNAILPSFEPEQRRAFFDGLDAIWTEAQDQPGWILRHSAADESNAFDLRSTGAALRPRQQDPQDEVQALLHRLQATS